MLDVLVHCSCGLCTCKHHVASRLVHKTCHVKVMHYDAAGDTSACCSCLQSFYLSLRASSCGGVSSNLPITARQLESLVRLAEARARAELREVVTAEDAQVGTADHVVTAVTGSSVLWAKQRNLAVILIRDDEHTALSESGNFGAQWVACQPQIHPCWLG